MVLNKDDILRIQRNKPPFLMIDRVDYLKESHECLASKILHPDEWFFMCHWEGDPNMPGSLQLEAMMQTASLIILIKDDHQGKVMLVTQVKSLSLKKKIIPKSEIKVKANLISEKRGIYNFTASISVNQKLMSKSDFSLYLPSTNGIIKPK